MMSRIRSSISPEKNSRAPSSSRILWPKNVHADQLGVGGHRPTNFSHKSKDAQYNFPSWGGVKLRHLRFLSTVNPGNIDDKDLLAELPKMTPVQM